MKTCFLFFLLAVFGGIRIFGYTVTSITTDEGFVYNADGVGGSLGGSGTELDPTVPTGLNNVTSFTAGGITYVVDSSYSALPVTPLASNLTRVIEPSDRDGSSTFTNANAFLTAGTQGLSLSTGVNWRIQDDINSFVEASVFGIEQTAFNDGKPDFFAADIARNQSVDDIQLLDQFGTIMAELRVGPVGDANADVTWQNDLGFQQLDRFNYDSNVNDFSDAEGDDDSLPVNAIAFGLEDFAFINGFSSSDLDEVRTIRVEVPDAVDSLDPKTDYAFFFAVDTDEILLEAPIVPELSSLLLAGISVLTTVSVLAYKRRVS